MKVGIRTVSRLLGSAGLSTSGPLVATLLIGRTGAIPSARWLAAALGTWALLLVFSWLVSPRAPIRPLALLAVSAPLLPVLYFDDAAYHTVSTGGHAAALLAYMATLALLGAVWAKVAGDGVRSSVVGRQSSLVQPPEEHLEEIRARLTTHGWTALVLGVVLMVGANDLVFSPLGLANRPEQGLLLAVNLVCLVVAAVVVTRPPDSVGGWWGAVCLILAWSVLGPWQEWQWQEPVGILLLLGAIGLVSINHRRWTMAGLCFGALAGLAPPAFGAVALFFVCRRARPGLIGLAAAACVLALRYVPLGRLPDVAGALIGTPHQDNVALAAFHLRLFLGAGYLTVSAPGLTLPAAWALTFGALVTGSLLLAGLCARQVDSASFETYITIGLLAGLLLAGTTLPSQLVLVAFALIPFARSHIWTLVSPTGQWLVGTCLVGGLALAGTAMPSYTQAAAERLSTWPPLASLPTLGILLLLAALLYVLHVLHAGAPASVVSENSPPFPSVDTAAAAAPS